MLARAPVGVGPRAVAFLLDVAFFTLIIVTVWSVAGGVSPAAEDNISVTDPNTAATLLISSMGALRLRAFLSRIPGTQLQQRRPQLQR